MAKEQHNIITLNKAEEIVQKQIDKSTSEMEQKITLKFECRFHNLESFPKTVANGLTAMTNYLLNPHETWQVVKMNPASVDELISMSDDTLENIALNRNPNDQSPNVENGAKDMGQSEESEGFNNVDREVIVLTDQNTPGISDNDKPVEAIRQDSENSKAVADPSVPVSQPIIPSVREASDKAIAIPFVSVVDVASRKSTAHPRNPVTSTASNTSTSSNVYKTIDEMPVEQQDQLRPFHRVPQDLGTRDLLNSLQLAFFRYYLHQHDDFQPTSCSIDLMVDAGVMFNVWTRSFVPNPSRPEQGLASFLKEKVKTERRKTKRCNRRSVQSERLQGFLNDCMKEAKRKKTSR